MVVSSSNVLFTFAATVNVVPDADATEVCRVALITTVVSNSVIPLPIWYSNVLFPVSFSDVNVSSTPCVVTFAVDCSVLRSQILLTVCGVDDYVQTCNSLVLTKFLPESIRISNR